MAAQLQCQRDRGARLHGHAFQEAEQRAEADVQIGDGGDHQERGVKRAQPHERGQVGKLVVGFVAQHFGVQGRGAPSLPVLVGEQLEENPHVLVVRRARAARHRICKVCNQPLKALLHRARR